MNDRNDSAAVVQFAIESIKLLFLSTHAEQTHTYTRIIPRKNARSKMEQMENLLKS